MTDPQLFLLAFAVALLITLRLSIWATKPPEDGWK